ncbi:uncharacterized [Tachysurus ichikawai]
MITEWLLISCPALATKPMDTGWGECGRSGHSPQLTEERKDTKIPAKLYGERYYEQSRSILADYFYRRCRVSLERRSHCFNTGTPR